MIYVGIILAKPPVHHQFIFSILFQVTMLSDFLPPHYKFCFLSSLDYQSTWDFSGMPAAAQLYFNVRFC